MSRVITETGTAIHLERSYIAKTYGADFLERPIDEVQAAMLIDDVHNRYESAEMKKHLRKTKRGKR